MTCTDCLYYGLCSRFEKYSYKSIAEIQADCRHFKNKGDFVEIKRASAKWLKRSNEMTCSACKFIYYSNNDHFNYCPNCGAKMK